VPDFQELGHIRVWAGYVYGPGTIQERPAGTIVQAAFVNRVSRVRDIDDFERIAPLACDICIGTGKKNGLRAVQERYASRPIGYTAFVEWGGRIGYHQNMCTVGEIRTGNVYTDPVTCVYRGIRDDIRDIRYRNGSRNPYWKDE